MHKGIEPVQTNRKLYQPFVNNVPPFTVGQFMKYNVPEIFLRNSHIRQYNTGVEQSRQHRRGNQRIEPKLHRPANVFLCYKGREPLQNFNVGNRNRPCLHISYKALVHRRLSNQKPCSGRQPDRPKIA